MKTLPVFIGILFLSPITMYAQTDWHITGNTGTNSGTNFIGTKDSAAFKIRTNNIVRMTINSSGNVGIGTTKPKTKFHLSGINSLAVFGTGTTPATYDYWVTGNDVGSYIEQVGNITTTGSDKFRIQSSKSGNFADYAQFFIDPNNGFSFLSSGAANGNVGIGTNSPAYKFSVIAAPVVNSPVAVIENSAGVGGSDGMYIKAGSNTGSGAYIIRFLRPDGNTIGSVFQNSATTVSFAITSDKRLKNIIGASQKGLSDLMKIKVYDYTFKSDLNKKVETGFMAQELYEIFPQAVSKPRDNNEPAEKNPWMVDYGRVTPLIIKSVQEQQQMIDELKKSNDELKKQIDELKALLISQSKENSEDKNQTVINQ
jgi:hypothetical protein